MNNTNKGYPEAWIILPTGCPARSWEDHQRALLALRTMPPTLRRTAYEKLLLQKRYRRDIRLSARKG